MNEKQFLFNIFIQIVALYITAYLSGYLSYSLEKTVEKLEEKDSSLKDLEFFNTKVIESLPSGLFTTDINGTVIIFNHAAELISGTKKESVRGKTINTALPFLDLPPQCRRYEDILSANNGSEKIIGLNISVLRDINGTETGIYRYFPGPLADKKA